MGWAISIFRRFLSTFFQVVTLYFSFLEQVLHMFVYQMGFQALDTCLSSFFVSPDPFMLLAGVRFAASLPCLTG